MDLMKNEKFQQLISEVNMSWPIKERIRYVLEHLGIDDETIIHIVTEGVQSKDVCRYVLWQQSGFLDNLDQKCKELFDAVNDFITKNTIKKNYTLEERIRNELEGLGICNENIIRIITAGVKVSNLYESALEDKSVIPEDFNQCCMELSSSVSVFMKSNKQNSDDSVGVCTFIQTLQKNIMRSDEIRNIIWLFQ